MEMFSSKGGGYKPPNLRTSLLSDDSEQEREREPQRMRHNTMDEYKFATDEDDESLVHLLKPDMSRGMFVR